MRLPFFSALWARLWKPCWRVLSVLVLAVVLHSVWASIEARRFQRLAERTAGARNRGDTRPPVVSAADNAARYYDAAWSLTVPKRQPWVKPDEEAWLKAMAPAVEMLDRAAALPACQFTFRTPRFAPVTLPAEAISARTRERIANGDAQGATSSVLATLLYLRVFAERAPGVVARLRPYVLESALADTQRLLEAPLASELAPLRKVLDRENAANHLATMLSAECDWTLRRWSGWYSLDRWLTRPLAQRATSSRLEYQSRLLEISRARWPERILGIVRLPAPASRWVRMTESALAGQARHMAHSIALSHAMAVCLRVEEHRRAHGRLPESLEALRTAMGESDLPVDPYTGHPLRYRAEPDAYVVYSVGEDGKDDAGAVLKEQGASDYGYRIRIPLQGGKQ